MRIGVISDIHGNDFAFEKVEEDIKGQGVDQIVCLGDAIQGGPRPVDVVQRLRRLKYLTVMGNADAWMLSGKEIGRETIPPARLKKMEVVRQWSLSQITDDDRAFIENFKPTITIELNKNLDLLCFHGSPKDFEDLIRPSTPEDEFQKLLGAYKENILTGGHTHTQFIRRIDNRFFFNPGSVGLVYNQEQFDDHFQADPWAEYAILKVKKNQIGLEFRRIPFDANKLIQIYCRSGRPFADEAIAQYQR